MATAKDIILLAYGEIGVHSHVSPADPSLIEAGLTYLRTALGTLAAQDITLDGIAVPNSLNDELSEPVASTAHLATYLAGYLLRPARINEMKQQPYLSAQQNAYGKLAEMFRNPDIPNIKPSRFLPRGQGAKGCQNFFNGEALSDDTSTTT